MVQQKISRSAGTHDGTFHADEVTACALLVCTDLVDKEKITRSRDPSKLSNCSFICDVGGVYNPEDHLFDHHQSDYKGPLSSAGMVLLYLKEKHLLTSEEYDFFNHSLIRGVDDHDNGRSPQILGYCSFSHVIANFNPTIYEASREECDKAFHEALDFAIGHLHRLKARFHENASSRRLVQEAMEKYKVCLVFDKALPWIDSFFALGGKDHPALFVMMPAGEHWKLRAIPPDHEHKMDLRVPLPQEWAGLLEGDLKKVTRIKGAIFCHKGKFTSVWETKEDASRALRFVLEKYGIKNEDNL
jgi:uncharacterized UPF0160 family protein